MTNSKHASPRRLVEITLGALTTTDRGNSSVINSLS